MGCGRQCYQLINDLCVVWGRGYLDPCFDSKDCKIDLERKLEGREGEMLVAITTLALDVFCSFSL